MLLCLLMVLFYVVNFNDDDRKRRMINRFRAVDIDLHFIDPVYETDPRIRETNLYKRTSAIMLQHIDSLHHFYYNTSAEHCVVSEDDIHISKSIADDMPNIINTFTEMNLDVLLLGYLWPTDIPDNFHFPVLTESTINNKYKITGFPDDLWGCQMYLVSRSHARYIMETFTIKFAVDNLEKIHYNPDWTITKYGRRGIITPMLAVEEGDDKSGHAGQTGFHKDCHDHNFNPDIHI